ncbi:MFS transporter [Nocardia fusca]|uniref:MFS transporter n=1 Tax=Nocardia fusca TaxID=941183 RepID=UPI0007A75FEE|nr:MFS transporter [Nocardia fusca]
MSTTTRTATEPDSTSASGPEAVAQRDHAGPAPVLDRHSASTGQPKAVWAVAFASVIAFMGIGLVDPILKPIGEQLNASPSQVSLLFTSYMLVTGVAMLVTGVVSSRFGAKKTLLAGLALIIVFAALAGMSGTVGQIVGFRAGWGLGNALFIATALATIVGAASGGVARAIILYEAALGIGIATGPLLGGVLGGISWRGPFFGVSVLMAVAFIAIVVLLPEGPKAAKPTSLAAPFQALRHRGLLVVSITALLYNFGFFTLLAYTPFPLDMGTYAIGFIFCGWGILLAVASVFFAPKLQHRFGTLPMIAVAVGLFAADLAVMALFAEHKPVLIAGVVLAGLFLGVNNTLITEAVMISAPVERSTASAAYSFVRFAGGAAAPWLAGKLGETSVSLPFWVGAVCTAAGVVVLLAGRSALAHIDDHDPAPHSVEEAQAVTVGD